MGLFVNKAKEAVYAVDYQKDIVPNLQPSNGTIHVLLFNVLDSWNSDTFNVKENATKVTNSIIDSMKKDGFETINVSFQFDQNNVANKKGYFILIQYK